MFFTFLLHVDFMIEKSLYLIKGKDNKTDCCLTLNNIMT